VVLPSGRLQPYSQTLYQAGKARQGKHLRTFLNYGSKKSYNIVPMAQCYKTFYIRNLQMFVLSLSVCPCQPFAA
jgi:hypothetical protein